MYHPRNVCDVSPLEDSRKLRIQHNEFCMKVCYCTSSVYSLFDFTFSQVCILSNANVFLLKR